MSKVSDRAKKKKREQKKKAALLRKQQQEKEYIPHIIKKEKLVSEKIVTESKSKRFFKSAFFKISIIVTLISIPSYLFWFKDKIHEWTTPKNKLYEEENAISGILIPEYISRSLKYLNIGYGSFIVGYQLDSLKVGVNFSPNLLLCNGEPIPGINFMLLNNRIYVSTDIRDLKTGELVGSIDYNHWSLIKHKFITYSDSDTSLEVIDNYKNVAFSLVYSQPNTINLQGYFVLDSTITIISNGLICFHKNDVEIALERIKQIKRLNQKY
jgi:hypothetical protein